MVAWDADTELRVGDALDVDVELPGAQTLQATAQVRWQRGKGICGIQFDKRAQSVLAAFFASFCGLSSATNAHAAASVPTFDPNADVVVNDDGGERPDEYEIEQAFFGQNAALDRCVTKATRNVSGDATVSILLNPKGDRPLGINAELPRKLARNKSLRECIRTATAGAPFPAYDGPPVVVDLRFELAPGTDYEED